MMKDSTSPFSRKKGVKRSPNKFSNKRKFEEQETKYISDKDESLNMTYENDNQLNFPQKSELSVKSSNTHKIASFNKNQRSDQGHINGTKITIRKIQESNPIPAKFRLPKENI